MVHAPAYMTPSFMLFLVRSRSFKVGVETFRCFKMMVPPPFLTCLLFISNPLRNPRLIFQSGAQKYKISFEMVKMTINLSSGTEIKQDSRQALPAKRWKFVDLPKISDVRGNLSVIEGDKEVPFNIARVYYIYDVPSGSTRAGHAHKRLRQLFIALSGSFSLHLEDGRHSETLILNRPHIGVLVEPGTWRVIDNFSGGAVCIVFASLPYDESDYIRSYSDFLTYSELQNAT